MTRRGYIWLGFIGATTGEKMEGTSYADPFPFILNTARQFREVYCVCPAKKRQSGAKVGVDQIHLVTTICPWRDSLHVTCGLTALG